MLDSAMGEEAERLYILPMEDGDTVVVFKDNLQPNYLHWPLESSLDQGGDSSLETLANIYNAFPYESNLKVSLFREMCLSLPKWAEIEYDWLEEVLRVSESLDIARNLGGQLGGCEAVLVKWLLSTLTQPKIRLVPTECIDAVLEAGREEDVPKPSLAYLVEQTDRLRGDLAVGFVPLAAGDVLSLLYLFPEAGRGWKFTPSLSTALESKLQSFYIAPLTHSTYRVVLMVEYVPTPSLEPVGEAVLIPPLVRDRHTFYRIGDPSHCRPRAVLLYSTTRATVRSSSPAPGFWVLYSIFSLAILANVLYKLKLIQQWSRLIFLSKISVSHELRKLSRFTTLKEQTKKPSSRRIALTNSAK